DCARALSGTFNYVATVQINLLFASQIARLVVRYLVMPRHLECCLKPVADWTAQKLPFVTFH
ncbi:MAG: radical SAM protein, partial [Armatimonadetes bacterium]|nr:radical SAM protein [Armatimonadota bacterium]